MEQTSFQRIKNCEKNLASQCRGIRNIIRVLACAATVFGVVSFIALGNYRLQDNAFYILFTMMYVLMSAAGIALSTTLFKELYNKPFADSAFSQPFTSSERYFAKLWLIVKAHILPMAAVTIIVPLTAKIVSPAMSANPRSVLIFMLYCTAGAVFADACFFLFAGFCGTGVSCVIVPAAMAVAVSLLPFLIVSWFYSFSGIVTEPVYLMYQMLAHFGMFDYINFGELIDSQFTNYASDGSIAVMVIINFLLAALMFFLGNKVYGRRSGLTTGKPFVSAAFYNVFYASCIVPLFLISMRGGIYNGIIWSLIASLVITVIRLRKKFNMHALMTMLIRMVACCGAALCLTFIVYVTCGFGISEISPENSSTEGCRIDLEAVKILRNYQETIDIDLTIDWRLNTAAIEPGQEKKVTKAIFDYMNEHSDYKPEHTAETFKNELIYGSYAKGEEDPFTEREAGKWSVSLYINPKNSSDYYYYYVYMTAESMKNMPAELAAQGVPIEYKDRVNNLD